MNSPRRPWLITAALLVAAGTVGSVLGASVVARNDAQQSHLALVASSMGIASNLKLAIQQENSLVISAKAFILANPDASNAAFLSWVGTMQVDKRFPEVGGIGYYEVVRTGQLPAFVARILADPPQTVAPVQSYQITPPGNRPFYCLADFTFQNGGVSLPLGYDVCAGYDSAQLNRAFAGSTYVPYKLGKKDYLADEVPGITSLE
jgi:CHASE1-domain containing sensor protein